MVFVCFGSATGTFSWISTNVNSWPWNHILSEAKEYHFLSFFSLLIGRHVQAADFLVDKATVKELCTHASTALFAAFIESGEGPVDAELELVCCCSTYGTHFTCYMFILELLLGSIGTIFKSLGT